MTVDLRKPLAHRLTSCVGRSDSPARLADRRFGTMKEASKYATALQKSLVTHGIETRVDVVNEHILYLGLHACMLRVNVSRSGAATDVSTALEKLCPKGTNIQMSETRADSYDVTVPLPSETYRLLNVVWDVVLITTWVLFISFVIGCLYYVHPDFYLFYWASRVVGPLFDRLSYLYFS